MLNAFIVLVWLKFSSYKKMSLLFCLLKKYTTHDSQLFPSIKFLIFN